MDAWGKRLYIYFSTDFAEGPPTAFFDVQLDISATLAANAAALEGKPVYARLMHEWRVASAEEVTSEGRIPIGVLASFVEGFSTTSSSLASGAYYMLMAAPNAL